jgi:hypothetical protein
MQHEGVCHARVLASAAMFSVSHKQHSHDETTPVLVPRDAFYLISVPTIRKIALAQMRNWINGLASLSGIPCNVKHDSTASPQFFEAWREVSSADNFKVRRFT